MSPTRPEGKRCRRMIEPTKKIKSEIDSGNSPEEAEREITEIFAEMDPTQVGTTLIELDAMLAPEEMTEHVSPALIRRLTMDGNLFDQLSRLPLEADLPPALAHLLLDALDAASPRRDWDRWGIRLRRRLEAIDRFASRVAACGGSDTAAKGS